MFLELFFEERLSLKPELWTLSKPDLRVCQTLVDLIWGLQHGKVNW